MLNRLLQIFVLLFFFSGCAVFKPSATVDKSEFPDPDTEILAILDMYRAGLDEVMGKQVAVVRDTLRFDKPEGALSNMAADALRFRAALELREFVHLGVIGESSFQTYFTPGILTLGDIYEFMPYENNLVVLELKGEKVIELMDQVAGVGGAPVSGARFRIDDQNRARGLLVNAEVVDPNKNYLIATSSWLADGGDRFSSLWDPVRRIDFDISIRNLYVDFFYGRAELYDQRDGRIR